MQASTTTVKQRAGLTQKLWLWLRLLGKGLSKYKRAVDKGRGRFGGLLKYGGSWEERPRLNGIQYGTQAVTCNVEDNGNTIAFTVGTTENVKTHQCPTKAHSLAVHRGCQWIS